MAAAEVLAINKLKGLGCQNDTGRSIEPQRLFGALSNQGVVVGYCGREGDDPTVIKATERAGGEGKAAEDHAFANKLAKRSPPNKAERAEVERTRKRTKARAPRIAMHIEDRGTGTRVYPDHSDEEGHRYRLADTFGTRSLQFVYSMLKGLGKATADHSEDHGFNSG